MQRKKRKIIISSYNFKLLHITVSSPCANRKLTAPLNIKTSLDMLNVGFEPRISDSKSPADWMPADKPTELLRIKLKKNKKNSTARPYDQRAFSPLDPTASWLSHMALVIYLFVVVNFDALAQASDFQIERRQVVFLCWMHDSKLGSLRHQIASRLNAHSQTDWAIDDEVKNLNSIARPYDDWALHNMHLVLPSESTPRYMYTVL